MFFMIMIFLKAKHNHVCNWANLSLEKCILFTSVDSMVFSEPFHKIFFTIFLWFKEIILV